MHFAPAVVHPWRPQVTYFTGDPRAAGIDRSAARLLDVTATADETCYGLSSLP
ncbi:hypothetical protein ABGB18_36665 [Nonomuraea sp. B12E4]|uniref:hypothetical protein n=1 Tax=Nonomuraea sp. B12E4 TaxID=3153564 RepID=UPI00325DD0AE